MNINDNSNVIWTPKNFKMFHMIFIVSYFSSIYFFMSYGISSISEINTQQELRELQPDFILTDYKTIEHIISIESFLRNMDGRVFRGKWTPFSSKNNEDETKVVNPTSNAKKSFISDFDHNEGDFTLRLDSSRPSQVSGLKKLILDINIKDGGYKEKWLNIQQEYFINVALMSALFKSDLDLGFNYSPDKFFTQLNTRNNTRINSMLTKLNLYQVSDTLNTQLSTLDLTFRNRTLNYMKGRLMIEEANLDLELEGTQQMDFTFDKKVSNFTLVLTFIGILHIYNSLIVIKEIILGLVNPKSFSTLFVCSNLVWNAIISIGSFYVAINFPNYFTDFALPSIIFFIDFSVFQIRLMFVVWRFLNLDIDLSQEDVTSLRRKMLRFYILLYFSLFLSLFSVYFILLHKWVLFSIAIVAFIPQIIHNSQINISKNKIPFKSVLIVSLNRLYFPLYLRLCSSNIFETEPEYFYSFLLIGGISFQIFILYLQSKFGGLFFIPKFLRPGFFDYYKTYEQVKAIQPDIETSHCSICLNSFVDIVETKEMEDKPMSKDKIHEEPRILSSTTSSDFVTNTASSDLLLNSLDVISKQSVEIQITKINCREKLRKYFVKNTDEVLVIKLMMTPCKHIFHPECLKIWGETKNECPVCRNPIPCMDE